MRNRDDMVSTTNKKLDQLNKECEDLKDKIDKLDKDCSRNEHELKSASDQLEAVIVRNKEHGKRIKLAENSLRGIENELDKAILERDSLEHDNASYHAEHKLLDNEIDSVLLQIIECERINSEMQKEIENYIQADEEARHMLDRKSDMRKMLETVTVRLGQTGSHIAHLR
jgi:predicted  nucleic acid-binding Zn-ribbon protein